MVGSVTSTRSSSHGMDRFYSIPQRRREFQADAQHHRRRLERSRPSVSAAQQPEARGVETRVESDDSSSKPSVSSSPSPSPSPSPPPRLPSSEGNLRRFIESTTPVVRVQYHPKKNTKGWRRHDAADRSPYFTLGDFWEAYKEWSAYGAGVPLLLNESDSVIQYYVPYLSALQLYASFTESSSRPRHRNEHNDGEFHRDTSSEGSSGSTSERLSDHIPEASVSLRISQRLSRVSLCDKVHAGPEGSSSDDGEAQNTPGHLLYEFFERGPPYGREPLANKVSALSEEFPELKTYKSCDLLPSSWISVAWYPIYRIPTGPTLRDLDACFLTFHSLSKPSKSIPNGVSDVGSSSIRKGSSTMEMPTKLSLPVFGLASYKFRASIWTPNGLSEQEQTTLLHSAGEWLQRLQVDHPDFNFFLSRSNTYQR